MIGVDSPALGWFLVGVAALLTLIGVIGLLLRACFWISGILAERKRLRTDLRQSEREREQLDKDHKQLEATLHEAEQEREELRTENEQLMAEASLVSAWDDPEFKFTVVNKKTFQNESVPLDGRLYTNCTFENVTFVYKGQEPFGLVAFRVFGKDTTVKTEGVPLWAFSRLLNVLGYIKREIEKGDELRPDATVVRIEDGHVEILESVDEERERLRAENERLRAAEDTYLERDNARKQRIRFCKALDHLHGEGVRLRGGDHGPEEIQAWEKCVGDLIEAALPEDEARDFLESDPEEQNRMTLLLDRLKELIREILKREANPALAPVELRPGFDVWLWSPPEQE